MKGQVTTNYEQHIKTFRSTHFGRDPGPVRRLGYLIKAMIVNEKSSELSHGTRNSLLKIKARSIQSQTRIEAQLSAGQLPGSISSNIPRTISLEEFREAAAKGDYSQYGDNVLIDGNLDLSDMTDIQKLPKSLYVDGDLNLTGCKHLTTLPEKKLRVTGSLIADNCRQLERITQDIQVGEDLSFKQCHRLRGGRLPEMLRTMRYRADSTPREIHLEDTMINVFDKEYRNLSGEGVTFHVSNRLRTKVSEIINLSNWSGDYPELPSDKREATTLLRWLMVISDSWDFNMRKAMNILTDEMRDPVNKQIVMNVLSGISTNFEDDAILGMELIDKLLKLRKIKQSPVPPDIQNQLTDLFVGLTDFKQLASYHNRASRPGAEGNDELDRVPEFRQALLLALNLPEDASNQDILNGSETTRL